MNYARLALAALGGTIAYFAIGLLALGLPPMMRDEFRKYTAVCKPVAN